MLYWVIVQQILSPLHLSLGMKSIFLSLGLAMWHALATGKSTGVIQTAALNMLEWWTHGLVFQWFARTRASPGWLLPVGPRIKNVSRPEPMPKPKKPTTWSRAAHHSWAYVSPAEVDHELENKCLLLWASECGVFCHYSGEDCFIAIVRSVKIRSLSLNSAFGSIYFTLHLLYETRDSNFKIFLVQILNTQGTPAKSLWNLKKKADKRWK